MPTPLVAIGSHTTVVVSKDEAQLTCSSLGDEELATQLVLESLLGVLSYYIKINQPLAKKMQERLLLL